MSSFDPTAILAERAHGGACDCRTIEPTANGQPLTLLEVIDHEALGYRAWGTPAGEFLARQMERLAQLVKWTGAVTGEDHEARMEVWDESIRAQWWQEGHDSARADRHERDVWGPGGKPLEAFDTERTRCLYIHYLPE